MERDSIFKDRDEVFRFDSTQVSTSLHSEVFDICVSKCAGFVKDDGDAVGISVIFDFKAPAVMLIEMRTFHGAFGTLKIRIDNSYVKLTHLETKTPVSNEKH